MAVAVDYGSSETPPTYTCSVCRKGGIKLWRIYTSISYADLFCTDCGSKNQKVDVSNIRPDGSMPDDDGSIDSLGNLVPAIPTIPSKKGGGLRPLLELDLPSYQWWQRLPLR